MKVLLTGGTGVLGRKVVWRVEDPRSSCRASPPSVPASSMATSTREGGCRCV
jgi:hypothetical protein